MAPVAVAPSLLDFVHRHVRMIEQVIGFTSIFGKNTDPDAGRDLQGISLDIHGDGVAIENFSGDIDGRFGMRNGRQDDGKFVAAQSRERVAVAQASFHAFRDRHEQGIAEPVSQRIVDLLEVVEIDEHYRQLMLVAPCLGY